MNYRPEFTAALALLARAFDMVAAGGFSRPVLVGGAAVEFYTGGAIVSGDFDIVAGSPGPIEAALIDLGFVREDRQGRLLRGLYHPTLLIGVEVVSGLLFDGRTDRARLVIVQIGEHRAQLPPVEDMIADRMGQYASNPRGRGDMLDQAVALYVLAEDLDEAYLEKRIREETIGEHGFDFLKAKSDADADDNT